MSEVHAARLPAEVFRAIGTRRTLGLGDGVLVQTVVGEVARACERFGGSVRHETAADTAGAADTADTAGAAEGADLVLALPAPEPAGAEG